MKRQQFIAVKDEYGNMPTWLLEQLAWSPAEWIFFNNIYDSQREYRQWKGQKIPNINLNWKVKVDAYIAQRQLAKNLIDLILRKDKCSES